MARIRNIKPEFFDDEDLARVCRDARLMFVGLWTQADREGRLEDRPERLKVRLFPYDKDIAAADVEAMLADLALHRFIRRYAVAGRRLIQIPSFAKHQYVSGREPASELPDESQADPVESQPGLIPVSAQTQTGTADIGHRTVDSGRVCGTPPPPAFGKPLGYRTRIDVAWPGRPPVPGGLHIEFIQKLGGDPGEAEAKLTAWYPQAAAEWDGKPIGDDDWRFWRARFREWQGTTVTKSGAKAGASLRALEAV